MENLHNQTSKMTTFCSPLIFPPFPFTVNHTDQSVLISHFTNTKAFSLQTRKIQKEEYSKKFKRWFFTYLFTRDPKFLKLQSARVTSSFCKSPTSDSIFSTCFSAPFPTPVKNSGIPTFTVNNNNTLFQISSQNHLIEKKGIYLTNVRVGLGRERSRRRSWARSTRKQFLVER